MLDGRRRRSGTLAVGTGLLLALAGVARAATYDLVADEVSVTLGGGPVEMWGLGLSGGSVTVPGPVLEVPDGEDLIINLENNLAVPISLVVPGLGLGAAAIPIPDGNGRVQTFSAEEAAAGGGTASYTFPASGKPGTYLYESGTDPALQIPMGLYGAVVVRASTAGQAYDDLDARSAFDVEQVLVLSEVDPALNAAVEAGTFGTPDFPSTVGYTPRFFLVNGQPFELGDPAPIGNPGDRTLLRLLNAGSLAHAPTLGQRVYLQEIAQDASLLPFPQDRLTVLLNPGKTKDAVFTNPAAGGYVLYDRRLYVAGNSPGGMMVTLAVRKPGRRQCGLGFELALFLPTLLWLRARRRS
jgi:FtsP/CotA-like multicopper oxidase with cupredoxin domain